MYFLSSNIFINKNMDKKCKHFICLYHKNGSSDDFEHISMEKQL